MRQMLRSWAWAAVSACVLSVPLLLQGTDREDLHKIRMMQDLGIIQGIMQARYAPAQWKKKFCGWDLDEQVEATKERIRNTENITIREYQHCVRDLLASMKDYHVGVQFWATESAVLPFMVREAEGRFFIAHIDRSRLSETAFPFQVGDELVMFGEQSAADAVEEVRAREVGDASPLTDRALACYYLTHRSAQHGHTVPKGTITLTFRPKDSDCLVNHYLHWDYTEELVSEGAPYRYGASNPWDDDEFDHSKALRKYLRNKKMVTPLFNTNKKAFQADESADRAQLLGARDGRLPNLGDITWKSGMFNSFQAYIYEDCDGNSIGFIRIPHYSAKEWEAEEFRQIIDRFEEETDALVIDQLDNPGGSVFYLYALVSMLADQPMVTPKHQLSLTQEDVYEAKWILNLLKMVESDRDAWQLFGRSLGGYPVTHQFVQFMINYFEFICNEWDAGKRLSDPHFLLGVDSINPHPRTHYSKPILVLVNELDFSGGDFLPAILQDNGRAVIMGTRTAGAGGTVTGFSYPNPFGVATFSFTQSLAERVNKDPIENLGVTPDIEYAVTADDLQNGHEAMADEVRWVIQQMIYGTLDL